jgi:hypothetical protein
MERNAVYTRWNVGLNALVTVTVLQVRYDAINWRVCKNNNKAFCFYCSDRFFRLVCVCTIADNKGSNVAISNSGLGFLFVVKTDDQS